MKIKQRLSLLLILCLLAAGMAALASEPGEISGAISEVDKYGNLLLDITSEALEGAGWVPGDVLVIAVGEELLVAPLGTAYSDVDTGSVVVRTKQAAGERLIVAINMGNFSETYGVSAGDPVTLSMQEPGGYIDEYTVRQLAQYRTNERGDYASDAVFANFRMVSAEGIGEGVLYRGSSPVNNELARAKYVDQLAQEAGVATVINLADSNEGISEYFAQEGFESDFYRGLYEAGQVIALDMGVDFSADDFRANLAEGLRFMIDSEAPYLLHCNEGKDRAGFVCAVLEALMGASVEEIKADYMESFTNYYHVELGSEQYEKVADSNVLASLRNIAGLEKGADLSAVDLAAAARAYLVGIGLAEAEIDALMEALKG